MQWFGVWDLFFIDAPSQLCDFCDDSSEQRLELRVCMEVGGGPVTGRYESTRDISCDHTSMWLDLLLRRVDLRALEGESSS